MLYLKIHETDNGKMVAMCDEPLINKVLEEGDLFLDIKNYGEFYKGELLAMGSATMVLSKVIKEIHSANVVGPESVKVAIEAKIVDKAQVKKIEKIPFAQAYKMIV